MSDSSKSPIFNRLAKNTKRLAPIAKKLNVEAYRLYDRDLPEYPYMIDRYGDYVILHDRREEIDFADPKKAMHHDATLAAIRELLSPKDLIVKRRERQRVDNKKDQQYQRLSSSEHRLVVHEGPAHFIVNLYDYLDTGLFLDHRRLREYVFKNVKTGHRFLNLFSYTGAVSVMAALAGANVTSVDLSNTYTNWAIDNFKENGQNVKDHEFVVADVLEFLFANPKPQFDWVFVDPPTFSNSKKMDETFEVERDQVRLIRGALKWLKPGGTMIFSNNKRTFRLEESLRADLDIREISKDTLPFDFHDEKIRHVFVIRSK